MRSGVDVRIVTFAMRGDGRPCALRGRFGEKVRWLRASASRGLDSCCGWGDRGSVVSELEDDDRERANRIEAGGARPDASTRSSSAVSSTMRGSKSAILGVWKFDGIFDIGG